MNAGELPQSGRFPSTIWTIIEKARLGSSPDALDARNQFVETYWRPIYCFLRARGYPTHKAEELTQEFMLQMMQRDWLQRADQRRGRLRSFVLRILVRFLSDRGPDRAPRQETFEDSFVEMSSLVTDEDRSYEPRADQTPEEIFNQRWAMCVVRGVLLLLKVSFEAQGKPESYEVFSATLLADDSASAPTQQALAQQYGISRDQVRYARQQAELRFLQLLREEIRCQLQGVEDVEAEVREILRLAQVHS